MRLALVRKLFGDKNIEVKNRQALLLGMPEIDYLAGLAREAAATGEAKAADAAIEAALGNPGDTDLAREPSRHKLIVFGHSLGGNLLISATKDEMIKQVRRHVAGRYFDPPIGNLVVLINPAAEAAK